MNIKNIYDCSYGLDWIGLGQNFRKKYGLDWIGLGPKLIGLDWIGLRKLDPCPTLGPLNPASGWSRERCKLPQRGLGHSPSEIEFGAF